MNLTELPQSIVQSYLRFPHRNEFVPVDYQENVLTVWTLKKEALPQADYLSWLVGAPIETKIVDETEFYPVLEQALGLWEEEEAQAYSEANDISETDEEDQELLGWSHEDAPIVRLVNKMLHQAISQGASDIHLEGRGRQLLIRYRLDGELHLARSLDRNLQQPVISRIKVMSEMDVAESRKPQDGRIQVKVAQNTIDIRVSTIPTLYGEKAVLRILDRSKNILSLPDLGMTETGMKTFRQSINVPYGIVLVTGPTGSGKTTSLYAGLNELIQESKNIVTIEDPVEYHLEGVNQVQVNPWADVTFANAIRSFLRQDPDIILVGEIRDEETASTAIHASLTGHLVLSTMHTNDAPTALTRLVEMNIEPFLVASSLTLVMGQRLVRRNCPRCTEKMSLNPEMLDRLGDIGQGWTEQYKGRGCEHCLHTGFKGRQGIFELMTVDDAVRGLLLQKASADEVRGQARQRGFRTMFEHGLELVRQGMTPLEEVFRVTSA